MFVTAENFTLHPYFIPVNENDTDSLDAFIAREEPEVLEKILGSLLADAFIEYLEDIVGWVATVDYAVDAEVVEGKDTWKSLQTPNLNRPLVEGVYWELQPQNKWLLLREGTTYLGTDGKPYKWKGMEKLFTRYIYAMKTRSETEGSENGVGMTMPKAENSEVVSSAMKVSRAYNEYSDLVGCPLQLRDTLYGYLYNSGELFLPEVEDYYTDIRVYLRDKFDAPGTMNVFNL